MKKLFAVSIIGVLLAVSLSSFVLADDHDEDLEVFGLELEEVLNLLSGVMAFGLFYLTFVAYRRRKHPRLRYVCFAFLLFAVNGFFTSLELFGIEYEVLDLLGPLLNFAIMLSFFLGVMKK